MANQFGYERSAAQQGIGQGIGVGQSIINIMKELANERQNNRLLNFQIQTHFDNIAKQEAERERNYEIQKRQLDILESTEKREAAKPVIETRTAGQELRQLNPLTGQLELVTPAAQFAPGTAGENPQIKTAQAILQSKLSTPEELGWARRILGVPEVPQATYGKGFVINPLTGAPAVTKTGMPVKKHWWTSAKDLSVTYEPTSELSPAMQSVAGAGIPQPVAAPQAPAQPAVNQVDTVMLDKLTSQISSYGSRQEAVKDIDRLIKEGKINANLKVPLYRAIRTQLK